MWTLQEYSKVEGSNAGFPATGCNSGVWSTWWAQVSLAPTAVTLSDFSAKPADDFTLWALALGVAGLIAVGTGSVAIVLRRRKIRSGQN
jgi:hypothetical protein